MINSRINVSRLFVLFVAIAAFVNSAILPTLSNTRAYGPPASIPLTTELDNNAKETARARVGSAYAQLGMRFEKNQGQFDAQVKFAARGAGYALWLTGDEAVMSLRGDDYRASAAEMAQAVIDQKKSPGQMSEEKAAVIRLKLVNANRTASMTGESELPGRTNYFIGNDPANWHTGVSGYSRVVYKSVYRGVDLVYYGNGRELEYDFKVAAGANPAAIGIRFDGAKRLRVDPTGDLVIGSETGELRQHKPLAYQEAAGERREVSARYVLRGRNQISFALGRYDHSKPLVIDPVLAYSTYLGGTNNESINAITVDAAGNAYLTGSTSSPDFPVVNPIGTFNNFGSYVFVSKLNPAGNALVYSTYISGTPNGNSSSSAGLGITLDAAANAYVTGQTNALNFPTTPGAFQSINHGYTDAFALKLNAGGSALVYSTYLGGVYEDSGKGIGVDSMGNAYVTGQTVSADFPKASAMQPTMGGFQDAFVTKLNATGTALVYSTFLGGGEKESGNAIAVDSSGNAYVTGGTSSDDFPVMNALQPSYRGRGAFRSTDSGDNWAAVSNSFPFTTGVSAVVIDPFNSSTTYIGTSDRGLFKSTDGGSSWIAMHNGIPDLTSQGYPGFYDLVWDLEIDPKNPMTLFAGTYGSGGFKSTDGGNSWTRKVGVLVTSFKIDPANSANVYCTEINYPGFLQSTDYGETWDQYGNISSNYGMLVSAIAPTHPAKIYVGTNSGGIFRFDGTTAATQSLNGNSVRSIAFDPTNPSIVYAGTATGMFKSTNSGDTWTQINDGLLFNSIPAAIVCLAIDPQAPNTIYAGSSAFVFKSTNGGATWVQRPGLPTAYMYDIAVDPHATSRVFVGANNVDDAFVSKLNAAGSGLTYSTYIGGLDIDDGFGIAVDAARNVYVCGTSYSTSIAGVTSAFPRKGISDALVLKLGAAGSLSYFSYIGGTGGEQGKSIAVCSAGNTYIIGNTTSPDFPTTPGAIPVGGGACTYCTHAFVTKLNQQGTTFLYSSYLGGNPDPATVIGFRENGNAIAVDSGAGIYVAGQAFSTNFPVTAGAFDTTHNGSGDGFVSKLNLFDICMQDDTNGNLLRFNSTTGDYLFTNCRKGMVFAGKGSVTTNFCKITLNASMPGQTLTALANTCTRAASAQLVAQGKTLTITDKDMGNDSCTCK